MTRPLSLDLRERVLASVLAGESCRSVADRFGVAVSSLHGLKEELAARGVKVSHNTVWLFLRREGLRFKKHCSPLSRLAQTSLAGASVGGPGRPSWIRAGSCSSMRHGSKPTWPLCEDGDQRGSPAKFRATRPLAHPDVPGRATPRPAHSTLCLRWTNQRRMLPRLRRAPAPANAEPRRYRHSRQSRQSQVEDDQTNDPNSRRKALVPAAILPRPQSDRASLRQDQTLDAPRSAAHRRGHLATRRRFRRDHPSSRMRQLLRERRLRFNQI